jgi:ribosomal protein S6
MKQIESIPNAIKPPKKVAKHSSLKVSSDENQYIKEMCAKYNYNENQFRTMIMIQSSKDKRQKQYSGDVYGIDDKLP